MSHRRVEFAAVLKTASHIEVLKLYMFLLEKYKALDAATLHAIATFLGRICNELRLEPMLYQVCVPGTDLLCRASGTQPVNVTAAYGPFCHHARLNLVMQDHVCRSLT